MVELWLGEMRYNWEITSIEQKYWSECEDTWKDSTKALSGGLRAKRKWYEMNADFQLRNLLNLLASHWDLLLLYHRWVLFLMLLDSMMLAWVVFFLVFGYCQRIGIEEPMILKSVRRNSLLRCVQIINLPSRGLNS